MHAERPERPVSAAQEISGRASEPAASALASRCVTSDLEPTSPFDRSTLMVLFSHVNVFVCVCVFLHFPLSLLLFYDSALRFCPRVPGRPGGGVEGGHGPVPAGSPAELRGRRVQDPGPSLPESLSGFEMGGVIEAKPLIAISL